MNEARLVDFAYGSMISITTFSCSFIQYLGDQNAPSQKLRVILNALALYLLTYVPQNFLHTMHILGY